MSFSLAFTFNLFIYLGFYVAFNTVQVISRQIVGRAEETSTYSSLGFCTVNCRPTASNYQLSHLKPCRESNPGLRGGRAECYHSATVAPFLLLNTLEQNRQRNCPDIMIEMLKQYPDLYWNLDPKSSGNMQTKTSADLISRSS